MDRLEPATRLNVYLPKKLHNALSQRDESIALTIRRAIAVYSEVVGKDVYSVDKNGERTRLIFLEV